MKQVSINNKLIPLKKVLKRYGVNTKHFEHFTSHYIDRLYLLIDDDFGENEYEAYSIFCTDMILLVVDYVKEHGCYSLKKCFDETCIIKMGLELYCRYCLLGSYSPDFLKNTNIVLARRI